MKKNRDPLYRTVLKIHRKLQQPRSSKESALAEYTRHLGELCRATARGAGHWTIARQRGWTYSATRTRQQLLEHAQNLHQVTRSLLSLAQQPALRMPSISLLLAEVRQLHDEFEEVDLDMVQEVITAQTDSIELEGVELGPFDIRLELADLLRRPDYSCFRCVARDPHPAHSNTSITHPHVQDTRLCAGEAAMPIARALAEGRLCDAFLLVRSVLYTYNPQSPYVSLDRWEGVSCNNCDRTISRNDTYSCERCGSQVCEDCSGSCSLCEVSCCDGCLDYDAVSRQHCCSECRMTCVACQRVVNVEQADLDTGLCPRVALSHQESDDETETAGLETVDPEAIDPDSILTDPSLDSTPSTYQHVLCRCGTGPSFPEEVYALIPLSADQASALLELCVLAEGIWPMAADGSVNAVPLPNLLKPIYFSGLPEAYEQTAAENADLCDWHAVQQDLDWPELLAVQGHALRITTEGLHWQVTPFEDRYQLIESALLSWQALKDIAADARPFPTLELEARFPAVST